MKIYLQGDGADLGPYTRGEIFVLLKEGACTEQTPARLEGEETWSDVSELLSRSLFSIEQIQSAPVERSAPVAVPGLARRPRPAAAPSKGNPRVKTIVLAAAALFVLLLAGQQVASRLRSEDKLPAKERALLPVETPAAVALQQAVVPETPIVEISKPEPQAPVLSVTPEITEPPPVAEASRPAAPPAENPSTAPVVASDLALSAPREAPPGQPALAVSAATTTPPDQEPTLPPEAARTPVYEKLNFPPNANFSVEVRIGRIAEKPKRALVVCLDMTDDIEQEARRAEWADLAGRHDLLLITLRFSSPFQLLVDEAGFMRSQDGSGKALLQILGHCGVGRLPVLIYGQGKGGIFASSFAAQFPQRVASWAAYSKKFTTKPFNDDLRPALLCCEYEETKGNPQLLEDFIKGRARNSRWAWLNIATRPEERPLRVRQFASRYFDAVLTKGEKDGCWVGMDTMSELSYTEKKASPASAMWLPDRALLGAWKELMPASSESEEPTVIRKTVQTGVKGQPQLEMFLRLPPPSVLKNRPLRGTIAFCNWDGDPEVLQNRLLYRPGMKTTNAVFSDVANRIIRYAEHNDLAVLTWSVALVWNLSGNTGDLKRKDAADFERNFNKLASSWEEGVKFLHRKHGMPEKDMLLYGFSRGAQWAHRLALRKPDYFLAVHAQIASTYDTPTPQGQKVLWLITTGELEGGYENSKRFYKECRNLGYPIIYKAIEGIGHIDSFQAQLLGYRFFNYALTLREKRSESFKKDGGSLALNARSQPAEWLSGYRNPPYVGDLLNQEVFAASESEIISDSLRVPLPTKEIANTWGNAEPLRAEAWDE